jgi:hypothetical protein
MEGIFSESYSRRMTNFPYEEAINVQMQKILNRILIYLQS